MSPLLILLQILGFMSTQISLLDFLYIFHILSLPMQISLS